MSTQTLQAGLLKLKAIGWSCILIFLSFAFLSWWAGQASVSPFFILAASSGLLVLLPASKVEMDSDFISVHAPIGRFQMACIEIQRVEIGAQGTLVLIGANNSQLVVPAHSFWSGSQKAEMFELFCSRLDSRGIDIVEVPTADYRFHKNSRVPSVNA